MVRVLRFDPEAIAIGLVKHGPIVQRVPRPRRQFGECSGLVPSFEGALGELNHCLVSGELARGLQTRSAEAALF